MLVFTSFGFRAPIVKEKLRDVIDPKNKTILIIPFAGYNPISCALNEKNGLIDFGFKEDNIYICSDLSSFERAYNYIYVPGGYTFKLLSTMQSMQLMESVKRAVENGATYIGVSAGAELATVNLEYVRFLEDNNYSLVDYNGLSLVREIIIPHADQHRLSEQMRSVFDTKQSTHILRIANDEVAVCEFADGLSKTRII